MYCSNSKSPASAASLPVLGEFSLNMYSALAPKRLTLQGRLYFLIVLSTPSDQRFPSFTIFSKFSAVSTLVKVAFIAAIDNAFAASVPPTPPVSITSSSTISLMDLAISSRIPKAPVGNPPPIALPIVKKSGCNPS